MDPGGGGKVAYLQKYLRGGLPQAGQVVLRSAIGWKVKGGETGRWNPMQPVSAMRDLLFVLIYLAMVLTPAVVAARSGGKTGSDE